MGIAANRAGRPGLAAYWLPRSEQGAGAKRCQGPCEPSSP